jgi:hypothetical protein
MKLSQAGDIVIHGAPWGIGEFHQPIRSLVLLSERFQSECPVILRQSPSARLIRELFPGAICSVGPLLLDGYPAPVECRRIVGLIRHAIAR